MMSQTLQLLLLAAVTAGAGIVLRRFSWKDYPALITWMLWEVVFQAATFGDRALPQSFVLVQDGICAAAICEVMRDSRLRVSLSAQVRYSVCVVASAKILAGIPNLTGMQGVYLFRSYCLWGAFAALAAVAAARWWRPVLERRVSKVYRIGLLVWVFELAASGSFVKGGIGYMLFPYTKRTYVLVNQVSYAAVMTSVLVMAVAMYLSAPGRKHAAKKPDGKTVTGLIQMERVA